MSHSRETLDYRRVEKAIRYVDRDFREQPTLNDIADHLGMSPWHVQRLFRRWAGVSPKRFLQSVTLAHARERLLDSATVLEASLDVGLSGPGRLHDLTVTLEGVTPGEIRSGGDGVELRWGVHPTPFGPAFFAATERALSALFFLPDGSGTAAAAAVDELERSWPGAGIVEDPETTGPLARKVFRGMTDGDPRSIREAPEGGTTPLRLRVRGTNFQLRVWEALLRIPPGCATTYGRIAERVGSPGGARAVGGAVGRNPVAFVIPCHRVLRASGALGGYRWGGTRKRAILSWERSRRRPCEGREEA